MKLSRALDLFDIKLAEDGCKPTTRKKYIHDILTPFADTLDPETDVAGIDRADCRLYLGRWVNKTPSWNSGHTALNRFFGFCVTEEWRDRNPMEGIDRRRRPNPVDLDVTSVESEEVADLFAACAELDEFLTIAILAYTGVRRSAAANLHWRDLDLNKGYGRFQEKGGKINVLPLPDDLREILYQIGLEGQVPCAPDDYVIPNRRPGLVGGAMGGGYQHAVRFYANKRKSRNNKVVYNNVKRVAERAGNGAHPHALRAAFAVLYYEARDENDKPLGDVLALKDLLNHARIETTEVYLRRRKKAQAKETVRSLSWGSRLQPSKGMPPAGFEPALQPTSVSDHLGRKLEELRAAQRGKARDRRS